MCLLSRYPETVAAYRVIAQQLVYTLQHFHPAPAMVMLHTLIGYIGYVF
jgi:hypothetical protein